MKIEGFKNAVEIFGWCFLVVCAASVREGNLDQDKSPDCPQDPWIYADGGSEENDPSVECFMVDSREMNATCINGFDLRWMSKNHPTVRNLMIVSWPNECLSPSMIFNFFPKLETLSIINSSSIIFSEDFPDVDLRILQLNGLTKLTLRTKLLSKLKRLETLDLRGNNLTTIHPNTISSPQSLKSVMLLNNRWNCSHSDMHWLAYLNTSSQTTAKFRISDYDQLTCQGSMYPGKPLHVVMEMLKLLNDECPKECSCLLSNLVRKPEGVLVPVVTVDCRNRGLLTMPSNLPSITTVLLLHGNNISELRPLAQNSAYRKITEVYLDNNFLSSVRPLEGSDWIMSFRLLSLRGNNLSQLPLYFFDHAFQYNMNIARVYLGNNPWKCNCHFTPRFQELILKYKDLIGDIQDIRCKVKDQKELSKAQISTLSRSIICRQIVETLNIIDVVNIFLASLIVLVVGKFGYDYYYFKKTGRLPWISSKIP